MNTKRYLSLLLVFVLIFSGVSSMATGYEDFDRSILDRDEDIRIIVQVKEEPAINYLKTGEKYSDISGTKRASLERAVLDSQRYLEDDLSRKGINLRVENRMTVAVNAFSTIVKASEIEEIMVNSHVKDVFLAREYDRPETPRMTTSHDMIGSNYAWNTLGYKGEGMLVAIVDTGIDPSHKDMRISHGLDLKLSKRDVEAKGLPGSYRSEKVPYGYNYFDKNDIILDTSIESHGMHVAGTVAANGEIKGVAPEAQLLAMKVFSRDPDYPATSEDIYMKAIDDAIKLGADVINMSLGNNADFYKENSPMDQMISNARDKGIIFGIAAGNNAYSTHGSKHQYPSIYNPDTGIVGNPTINKDSISVASIENTHIRAKYILYDGDKKAIYAASNAYPIAGEYMDIEFVEVGLGYVEDFKGKDLNGKVALISRGDINFIEKIFNAQDAGAVAVIIYNHEEGGDEIFSIDYAGEDTPDIPNVFIGHSDGKILKDLRDKRISFPDELTVAANKSAWQMSDFTSWGTTPTLDIKPEITAPGGQIYSTLEEDNYGVMSGTSMATPHLVGGAALLAEYIKREHRDIAIGDISDFSKILLMNTATPILDSDGNFYSPRRQGAGLMNLTGALTTGVTVVNKYDGEAKVKLGDFEGKRFSINLIASNHSDKSFDYDIEVHVLGDYIDPEQGLNMMRSESLEGVRITGTRSISLEPGESKNISLSIDIEDALIPGLDSPIEANMFIEGFIRLVASKESTVEDIKVQAYPSLVVPYMGFYGDWYGEDSPRILDGMEVFSEYSYFEEAGIVNQDEEYMGIHPIMEFEDAINRLAISPGSEGIYANTSVNAKLSFMRNAEEVKISILDRYGREIRKLNSWKWVQKEYFKFGGDWYSLDPANEWDGSVNGDLVEDGKYFYQIKAKPQNGQYQVYRYPIYVDTLAPEIVDFKYQANKLSFKVIDENLSHLGLYIGKKKVEILGANRDGIYEIQREIPEGTEIVLEAYDHAWNLSTARLNDSKIDGPTMKFDSPQPFFIYDNNSLNLEGQALSKAGIESLMAYIVRDDQDAVEVDVEFDQEGHFNKELENLEDGSYTVRMVVKDILGQEYEIFRYFYIDTSPPEIRNIDVEILANTSDRTMPGGGQTIILPQLAIAYHRDYLEGDRRAMKTVEDYKKDPSKQVYIKLSEGVYIDKEGRVVSERDIPGLEYYNPEGFIEEYDEYGNYTTDLFKTAKFSMDVFENLGYFEVYVNENKLYSEGEDLGVERPAFEGQIQFEMEISDDISEFEIVVVDAVGNLTCNIIEL